MREFPRSKPAVAALAAMALAALCFAPRRAAAEPEWWTGSMGDLKKAAQQGGKWIVLYFEADAAVSCIRMNEQTWPGISPADGANYLWGRVNAKNEKDKTFFDYYQVYQTPELLVLDAEGNEKSRLKGFVEPEPLKELLRNAYQPTASASTGKRIMLPDGSIVDEAEYKKRQEDSAKQFAGEDYFWYESFDALASLDPPRFNILVQTAVELTPADGKYNLPGLYIGADIRTVGGSFAAPKVNPAAQIQVALSEGREGRRLSDVDLVRGVMRVTLALRVKKLIYDGAQDLVELILVPRGQSPDSPSAKRTYQNLRKDNNAWTEKYVETEAFNFKEFDAYLRIRVNNPGEGIYVDDLRVELRPEGDVVATTAVRTPDPVGFLGRMNLGGGDAIFRSFDSNGNGRIERGEVVDQQKIDFLNLYQGFNGIDLNKDTIIDEAEWRQKKVGPPQ